MFLVNETYHGLVTTSLHTDHYELTMVEAALGEGIADRRCVFSAFARRVPGGGRYGVIAGVDAVLDAIVAFRFADADLVALEGVVGDATLDRLSRYRFDGTIEVVDDGELYLPEDPVVTVIAPFADAIVLETTVLAHLNGASGVATAAAGMRAAAGDRTLSEQGSRRVNPASGTEAARAAWVAGFDSTSNLAAGDRYGVPTTGTAAHAWTLLHGDDEQQAFEAQLRSVGNGTTLLVDTYDTARGIDRAIAAARAVHNTAGPGAIRIDSGDLRAEAHAARSRLDSAGAHETRIVVSGEVDEAEIRRLADAPVDGFGVGTNVVIAPSPGFVYKLVATDVGDGWADVAKTSPDKESIGGRRIVVRGQSGPRTVPVDPDQPPDAVDVGGRVATRTAIDAGRPGTTADPRRAAAAARERHQDALGELTASIPTTGAHS